MDTPVKRKGARAAPGPPPAETVAPAPDGGYAWFILLSCFMVFGLTFGVIKSFGVFFVEIHHYFESTATLASWITSIAVATIHVVAPLASALSAHYSHRSVVMIGGLICSIGMITGSFARNLFELYLTVGFLNGFGYALTWTPTVTMLGLYFDRRRPLANALASAGECILTFVLTPLSQLLIDSYSWRGALLILGGLQLNLCVCGQLLQPLKVSRDFTCLKEDKANGEEMEVLQKSKCLQKGDRISEEKLSESTEKTVLKTRILHYVDFTLITNARFMVYSMFGVFAALGFFAPSLYLVPYARSRGVEEYQSAALMSISSVLDLVGRVVFGWMANLRIIQTDSVQCTLSRSLFPSVVLGITSRGSREYTPRKKLNLHRAHKIRGAPVNSYSHSSGLGPTPLPAGFILLRAGRLQRSLRSSVWCYSGHPYHRTGRGGGSPPARQRTWVLYAHSQQWRSAGTAYSWVLYRPDE